MPWMCSTPEGIRGNNTACANRAGLSPICAQRPNASHTVWKALWPMCSTPEGIRGNNTALRRWTSVRGGCAQRPKASEGTTRIARCRGRVTGGRVLNARRPQREQHLIPVSAAYDVLTCSTPEGIRGNNTKTDRPALFAFYPVLNARRHLREQHLSARKD